MRMVVALSCLMLITPLANAGVPASDLVGAGAKTELWTDTAPKPRDPLLFKDQMLRDHNDLRARYKVGALEWDSQLAEDARQYANELATTQRFRHAAYRPGETVEGENLWMGTRSAYSFREMTGSWIEEGANVRAGRFPEVTTTGSWHDVGHFTQMVWGQTQKVGCAMAANAEDEVLVCRYFPAGNVMGEDMLGR